MKDHLQLGKVPAALFKELLDELPLCDPFLVVPPGIGRDAAGLSINRQMVAVSTDPVTIAADRLGAYSVALNINDVACLGCRPKWFTANILLPENTTENQLRTVWYDILAELKKYHIQLIGGHTEISKAVNRPVVVGQMIGQAIDTGLLNPANANPGDKILLWQDVPIEASALLAKERYHEMCEYFPQTELDEMVELLNAPGICVWPVVERLVPTEGLVSMHDPTEGGIATGLHEMADAANCGLQVNADAIPLLPFIRKISDLLAFDPLGVLAAGSLLILARPEAVEQIQEKLYEEPLVVIGELTESNDRVMMRKGESQLLPRYAQDEIFKALTAVPQPQKII